MFSRVLHPPIAFLKHQCAFFIKYRASTQKFLLSPLIHIFFYRFLLLTTNRFPDLQRRQQELERLEAARRERMRGFAGPPPTGLPPQGQPFHHQPPQQQPFHPQGGFMSGGQNGPGGGGPPPFGQAFGQPPQGIFVGNMPPTGAPPPLMGGQGGPPGGQGGPPPGGQGGMLQGQHGRSNMIEGVQRLLQIFKSDNGPGGMRK